jgi:hypothetical protein
MFEVIALTLPQYQQFLESCKQQFRETGLDRLTTLMSFVYADVVDFCLEVHRLFSRNAQGTLSLRTSNSPIPAMCHFEIKNTVGQVLNRPHVPSPLASAILS